MALFAVVAALAAAGAADPVVVRLERLTNCGGWKVAIHESGAARGELFDACHAGGPKKVSLQRALGDQVSTLRTLIERERFGDLDERPPEADPIEDDAACSIEVSFGKLEHQVVISGRQLAGSGQELESFRRVWRAVQRLVPEPE